VFRPWFRAILTFPRKVKCEVVAYRLGRRTTVPVASPEQIDAELDAFFDELVELGGPGRDRGNFREALGHACARVEEWTA
jgi:hypothetical protein